MGMMIIRHKVRDCGLWRTLFIDHAEMQKAAGLTNPRGHHSADSNKPSAWRPCFARAKSSRSLWQESLAITPWPRSCRTSTHSSATVNAANTWPGSAPHCPPKDFYSGTFGLPLLSSAGVVALGLPPLSTVPPVA